ncbi:signal recognition particle [Micromonospora sp. NBC_01655]|uniref:pPIWI_RE_Z domain-containing protein n=1 Tax=Micromonospora sp. NBC_01655 TaxID=2975983 RepID=UPI0022563D9E|nr:signal recognition particle [Micromonospora sp. NBC_01655]MCX4469379.1 signal recognition particle [Micromonospora sp. NBC_01655]
MRSTAQGFAPVIQALRQAGELRSRELLRLCEVELGLRLQRHLAPESPATDAWVLFSGYPFAHARGLVADQQGEQMLRVARYSLWTLRRKTAWEEALRSYHRTDPSLRGYDVPDMSRPATERLPAFAPDRWDTYDLLLRCAPPFTRTEVPVAGDGPHQFPVGRHMVTVQLSGAGDMPAPTAHDLGLLPAGGGAPVRLRWRDLLETAAEMDGVLFQNWVDRLSRTHLFTSSGGAFAPDEEFSVAGVQHLLGIVGAGKSTLRDVITVYLVNRHGFCVTVLVGDVAESLKLVSLYNTYLTAGRTAAPIIGASGRERHAQRLHRRLASRGEHSILSHTDPSFNYLSTSCAINALLPEDDDVLPYGAAPCARLQGRSRRGRREEESGRSGKRHACPYWSGCPRHHGARELVDAHVWVATPPSLIDAAVPRVQNAEHLHYLELACRRSDLVIVDEADRVQMQLDRMFAPATKLVAGLGNRSLLDELNAHKIRELADGERLQLSNRDVEVWNAAVNTITAATDRLYAMLVGDHALRTWVRIGYFNAWTLQLQLLDERYPDADEPDRMELEQQLDEFRDNPLGDRRPELRRGLVDLVTELLHTSYQEHTRLRLVAFVVDLFNLPPFLADKQCVLEKASEAPRRKGAKPPQSPDDWLSEWARRFEFTLLLAALESKLSLMNAMWPRVEATLKLGFNEMYRSPLSYGPVIPEAPMGNVLGFQFLVHGPDSGGVRSGELRYFRCNGIGRELLHAMPDIPVADGRPPTNVLLMSGSSWAGKSSRYHLRFPVGVLLKPDPDEFEAVVAGTEMRLELLGEDAPQLRVSGARPEARTQILTQMALRLGETQDGEASLLQKELLRLPEARRHLLLLVGSYDEAGAVADTLHTLGNRWRGRVLRLVADDFDEEFATDPSGDDDQHAGILRRGDVDTLRNTSAEVLVAPLLAVERGHNILNSDGQAAIGTVYFLARPNPRPDDIGLAVHAVNDWMIRSIESGEFDDWVRSAATLSAGAREVRRQARQTWYQVLRRSLAWSRLKEDRPAVTWDMLVLIWQVIGRLVRGGVHARVVFVDAAFMPNLGDGTKLPDTAETSLLYSIAEVLAPYFLPDSEVSPRDRDIVQSLYRPLWDALDRFLPPTQEKDETCTR